MVPPEPVERPAEEAAQLRKRLGWVKRALVCFQRSDTGNRCVWWRLSQHVLI